LIKRKPLARPIGRKPALVKEAPIDDEVAEAAREGSDAADQVAEDAAPPPVAVKTSATRCPFCHDDVDPDGKKAWVACSGCLARHHKGCWSSHKKCASCGSKKYLVTAERAARDRGFKPLSAEEAARERGRARGTPEGAVPDRARARVVAAARLLAHEGHIRAIAFWDILGGALLAVGAVVVMLLSGGGAGGLIGMALLGVGAAMVVAGRLLWSYDRTGRWMTVGVHGLGLVLLLMRLLDDEAVGGFSLLFNFGITGATLWALLGSNAKTIFEPSYQRLVAEDPRIKPAWVKSPLFWVPFAVILIQLVIVVVAVGSLARHHAY
jgi:hypothetical protein